MTYNFALQHCSSEPPLSTYFPNPASQPILATATSEAAHMASAVVGAVITTGADSVPAPGKQILFTKAAAQQSVTEAEADSGNGAALSGSISDQHSCQDAEEARQQQSVTAVTHSSLRRHHHVLQFVNNTSTTASKSSALPFVMSQQSLGPHTQLTADGQAGSQQLPGYTSGVMCQFQQPAYVSSADEQFPQRPGQSVCDFYARTGHCNFGHSCKFDHPPELAVRLSRLGLPLRHTEPICPYYAKTGACMYGPSCKFHHPEPPCSQRLAA